MGADMNPPASAIIWPTFTSSPGLTTGLAGAPMFMDMGTVITGGTGRRTGTRSTVFFLWGAWMPCNLPLNTMSPPLGNFYFPPGRGAIPGTRAGRRRPPPQPGRNRARQITQKYYTTFPPKRKGKSVRFENRAKTHSALAPNLEIV